MPSDGSRITDGPHDSTKTLDDLTEEEKEEIAAMKAFGMDDPEYEPKKSEFVLPPGPTKNKPMMAKPNAMTFFHIPLIESYDALVDFDQNGKKSEVLKVGQRLEGNGASKSRSFLSKSTVRWRLICWGD